MNSIKFVYGALICLLSSCAIHGTHPEGFAPYQQEFRAQDYKAVSPEGVTWRIHHEKHTPMADLQFWKDAVRKRMGDAGYNITDSAFFKAQGQSGFAFELAAPLGQEDFRYLVGAVPLGTSLIVIEAAGPSEAYLHRKVKILEALGNISN